MVKWLDSIPIQVKFYVDNSEIMNLLAKLNNKGKRTNFLDVKSSPISTPVGEFARVTYGLIGES